jgi:hypothetical protein
LSTDQASVLSTSQILTLETRDLALLTTASIAALTTAGMTVLTTAQIVSLTTLQVAALTTDQVSVLKTNQIVALETSDVAALTTAGIATLSTASVVALSTAQVAALTTSQLASGFSTEQIAALETRDLIVFSTAQISALTTEQVSLGLTTAQIVALKTTQLVTMTTDQIKSFTDLQLEALTTTQCESLTSAQVQALTTEQVTHLAVATPLILDLNGDGVTTQSISAGASFDLFATGQKVHTGWVAGGDGLLVMDRNHDGLINDGSELFGSSTLLSNGEKAANGYIALSAMDTNGDGVISSTDTGFADLNVWVDGNSDGITQSGELRSLDSLGVTKLDLAATASATKNNGNIEGLVSNYETVNGAKHAMADVWFVADKNEYATPPATSVGNSKSVTEDLSSRVGGLAQAIGSFNVDQTSTASLPAAPGVNSASSTLSATTNIVSANMGGVVEALKQFDPNGNPIGLAGIANRASTAASLTTPSLLDRGNNGILATTGK